MKYFLLLALTTTLLLPAPSQANTNHFGAECVERLDTLQNLVNTQ